MAHWIMADFAIEDRRNQADRRATPERRVNGERRLQVVAAAPGTDERRVNGPRRQGERRAGDERRLALPMTHQLRTVIDLLFRVNPGRLADDDRRRFDAAVLRLRYALDTLQDSDSD